jgi:diaminopimelate decarboxylase
MTINQSVIAFIKDKILFDNQPFYVYDEELIRQHCRVFNQITYLNKSIHFASMANTNTHFLNIVKDEGTGVFVNSIGHLKLMQEIGFKSIIFTASGLDENVLRIVKESGAQLNLDSPGQIALWHKLFPKIPVGIRCNIVDDIVPKKTHAGFFIGKKSRLGFTRNELLEIKDKSLIHGLHLYVGTDIMDIEYFIACYRKLCENISLFPNLEYLNFGGGFGVEENGDSSFDMISYGNRVTQLMEEVSDKAGRPIKLILEPGRIIGGNAGYFVCHVTDIKIRNGQRFVGVNASSTQFPRPLFYPDTAMHPLQILHNNELSNSGELIPTMIYGCSTYSRDFLRKNINLGDIEIGDSIIFGNAGSYSASSYTQFLGFTRPEEYFV